MILKETVFSTQMELFQDRQKWEELKNFYIAQSELKQFLDELKNENLHVTDPKKLQPNPQPEQSKALSLLAEINQYLEGKRGQPGGKRAGKFIGPRFYGVNLDRSDPYLRHNLESVGEKV